MKNKAVIFIVNSLCNGGAERVVANMANSYAKNYKVYIITLYNQQTYDIDKNVQIISLYNTKPSKYKKIFSLLSIKNKINSIIDDIKSKYEISLITSHLPYSNLLSKISRYRKNIINVIHTSYKNYSNKYGYIYNILLKFLYNNVPVVTVSRGCMDELLNYYKLKPSFITSIYNPINYDDIGKKMIEKIDYDKPYFLFVGRLIDIKRPFLLLEVFYRGKFYKDYILNIIGVGEYENELKNKIAEYGLEEKVNICGWKNNVYSYMHNANILISTSKYEAFPMTMIEALASNCPVVSFDIEYGPDEILTNDLSDYLAKDGDIDDMISKIRLAIKDYPHNLRERAIIYDVKNINSEYLKVYSNWNLNGESDD